MRTIQIHINVSDDVDDAEVFGHLNYLPMSLDDELSMRELAERHGDATLYNWRG